MHRKEYENQDLDLHMAKRNVYEKKQRPCRKRVDSARSCDDLDNTGPGFVFPPPPPIPYQRPVSASSYCYSVSDSDSQSESGRAQSSPVAIRHPLLTFRGYQSDGSPVALHSLPRFLPPIGVFWDIENCQVPKGRSAVAVAQVIRDKFFKGYREAEFLVVCDVKKENSQVVQELNDAQVNLIHVASTCKNAADEKLRQSIRRFADIHGSPAAIILISGDINFAADLTDLRHRKKFHVILLHNSSASEALILCASEHYNFASLMEDLPLRGTLKSNCQPVEIVVSNLPEDKDQVRIKNRLKQLSGNCGGKVTAITRSSATIRFSTSEFASRAQKRMDGEDVFGRKISVGYPRLADRDRKEGSPMKNQSVRKMKGGGSMQREDSVVYHSIPTGLNVLSSLPIPNFISKSPQNMWSSFVELGQSQDSSRNHSPLAGLAWIEEPRVVNYELKTRTNGNTDRTPDGYRRIRGTHKGCMAEDEEYGRPVPLFNGKKCRTPSPYTVDDLEHYFHPIQSSRSPLNPVELQVTNLDQNMDAKELKRTLLSVFREHVVVLHMSVFVQSDGNHAAHVKVPSLQDAQYAISQLHRRKVGYKRILISYANNGGPSPQLIRSQIISLLLEVPGHRLPLFKFREMFESRYLTSVSISDMYKMKDVCLITEELSGRMVSLNPDHRNTPSPCTTQDGQAMELPYCTLHLRKPGPDKGWAEQDMGALPNVRIGLKIFALHIHTLLQTHNGSLPLPSLPNCYEAQFEPLTVDEAGVPLEHLVSCLPGIEIYQGVGCVKYIRWLKSKSNGEAHADDLVKCVSPSLATQLALFSRELVDLLKMSPHCQLLFNRFIPAYHHHFGRQCRVADYGFTKLIDLMEALPHIVQVMGEGNKRSVTLSHRAQVRRFTSDLLRVLKSQASKQVTVSEFPLVYQRVIGRAWDVVDYGVCELRDILGEISENTVVMSTQDTGDILISIPKREQTPEEVQKTKQFAAEVVELLRHAPQCSMLFNKFIPAYHHHYGHQCRVADYGFTKLIELFEAIPLVVKVDEDTEGERKVTLTLEERLRVLAEQVSALVRSRRSPTSLSALSTAFLHQHGYALRPEAYECSSLEQLVGRLEQSVVLDGPVVKLQDSTATHYLGLQVRHILMQQPGGRMPAGDFLQAFELVYGYDLDLDCTTEDLTGIVTVKKHGKDLYVELTPIQMFARNVYHLLHDSDGRMPLSSFETAYLHKFGVACQPAQFGHVSVLSLLQAIPDTVQLRGRASVVLNKDLASLAVTSLKTDDQPLESGTAAAEMEAEIKVDRFLKSVLSNGNCYIFDSPELSKHNSPAKACSRRMQQQPLDWGPMWGGASPPRYMPYCHSTAFAAYMGGSLPPWPNFMSPTKNSPPPFHFPAGCLPHVVAPDPSELPLPQLNGMRVGGPDGDGADSLDSSNVSTESNQGTPNRTRRKRRLAAQFNTPIQLP